MRAKSPHLVKLTGVDPLGVVLPLKRQVPIEAGIEPARVGRRLQSLLLSSPPVCRSDRTRGHKVIIKRTKYNYDTFAPNCKQKNNLFEIVP